MRRLLLALWMLFAALGPATAEEPFVQGVRLHLHPSIEEAEASELVEVRVGAPLRAEAARRTVASLSTVFQTSSVALWSEVVVEGVLVHVAVDPEITVRQVMLVGHLGLRRTPLLAAIEQSAGAVLSEGRIVRSVFALQDLLERNGYLERSVTVDVDVDENERSARVVFRVDSGPRSVIAGARVTGELADFAAAEIEGAFDFPRGEKYSPGNERSGRRRAERWLRNRGYLAADLGEARFEREGGDLLLAYELELGPHVRLEVSGADAGLLQRRGLLPFTGDGRYDRAALAVSRQRIVDDYQSRGFFDVEVEVVEEKSGDASRLLRVEVVPGPEYLLESVAVVGAESFPASRLRELVGSVPRRRLAPGTGRLTSRTLAEDVANLRAFLVREGFAAAAVEPRVERSEGAIDLTFEIAEGARTRISSLEVEGGCGTADGPLLDVANIVGGPYFEGREDELAGELLRICEDRGFRRPRIEAQATPVSEGLVDVSLRVEPGPQTVAGRIVLRGAGRTDRQLLLRTLPFEDGTPVSRDQLLEAQRALYRLGVFRRADVRLAPGSRGVGDRPSGNVEVRDILVQLEESRRWRLGYGLGFDSEDGFGGLLSVTRSNLLQRGSSLRLDLNLSERERRARLLLSDRPSRAFDLPVRYALYDLEESFSAFRSERYGAQIESTFLLDRRTRLSLFYDYRIVELEAEDAATGPVIDEVLDRELLDTELSSLTATLLHDRRNDPIDPSRGWSAALQLESAFRFLDAEERFLKLFGQWTGYVPLGRLGALGASLRLGAVEPSDSSVSAGLLRQTIPISERFFAGGRTSHRAFRRDRLGVEGSTVIEGVEVGGEALALLNLDYRFPIAGSLGGTLFVDGGNVWARPGDVDPDEARWGAGLGLRYRSPIGPLRLEVAWKIDREPGESSPLFLVSFGNAF